MVNWRQLLPIRTSDLGGTRGVSLSASEVGVTGVKGLVYFCSKNSHKCSDFCDIGLKSMELC